MARYLQVACADKIDLLAIQATSAATISDVVLNVVKATPTSILVWRDLEARAAQLRKMHVTEVNPAEAPVKK